MQLCLPAGPVAGILRRLARGHVPQRSPASGGHGNSQPPSGAFAAENGIGCPRPERHPSWSINAQTREWKSVRSAVQLFALDFEAKTATMVGYRQR
jgi:hypothetical protein